MIPTRKTEDLLLGSWVLIGRLGRVPRRVIWDNEFGIGHGGRLAEGWRLNFTTTALVCDIAKGPQGVLGICARPGILLLIGAEHFK
jgi:hypothetical protein